MSSYIGKVQIGTGVDPTLIGSTLYGVCTTGTANAAKTVTLSSFDTRINGITVHVRFTNGNSVTSNVTLAIGSTSAATVVGNCVCNPNDIVAFTFYEETIDNVVTDRWYVNSNVVVDEGSTNGTVKVNGQDATVHGLGTAAYVGVGAFATAAQGTLAENAMPVSGGEFTGPVTLQTDITASSDALSLATKNYVDSKTAGLSGLTGAMHFKGEVAQLPTATDTTTFNTYDGGDVVLVTGSSKEYVYNKGENAAGSSWIELGDESSYVLKTSQTAGIVGSASGWNAGSASNAVVSQGVLQLTNSVAPTLSVTPADVIVPVTTP